MLTARPDDLALTLLLICQDAPPPEREGRAMEFGAQDKAGVLHAGVTEGERTVRFALRIVARPAADGGVDFAGPFVHGVPQGRFLYLGYRRLGETTWTRRSPMMRPRPSTASARNPNLRLMEDPSFSQDGTSSIQWSVRAKLRVS